MLELESGLGDLKGSEVLYIWVNPMYEDKAAEGRNEDGVTAVHKAVLMSDKPLLESLLMDQAKVNSQYCKGSTPLHLACSINQIAIVQMLLYHGADINATRNEDEYMPIHVAALCGYVHTVKMLIDKGANIDASNKFKNRPLHLAAGCGHGTVVAVLLENKANMEVLNASKNSPLALAAAGEHTDVVLTLLESGANVNCFYLCHCLLRVMIKWKSNNIALILVQYGTQPFDPTDFANFFLDTDSCQVPTLCQAIVESGNCPWLEQKIFGGIDVQKADLTHKLRSWLYKYQAEPQPLRVQCRKKIRGHLLHGVEHKLPLCKAINRLGMPQLIRNYLLMKYFYL